MEIQTTMASRLCTNGLPTPIRPIRSPAFESCRSISARLSPCVFKAPPVAATPSLPPATSHHLPSGRPCPAKFASQAPAASTLLRTAVWPARRSFSASAWNCLSYSEIRNLVLRCPPDTPGGMKSVPLLFSGVLAFGFVAHGADDAGLIADGAKVEVLSEGYIFTEGPAVDRDGNVFFTDQPNDRIVKYNAADGSFSDWLKRPGRTNGTFFDDAGNLIACADEKNELWSIAPDKKVTVLLTNFGGKLLNG